MPETLSLAQVMGVDSSAPPAQPPKALSLAQVMGEPASPAQLNPNQISQTATNAGAMYRQQHGLTDPASALAYDQAFQALAQQQAASQATQQYVQQPGHEQADPNAVYQAYAREASGDMRPAAPTRPTDLMETAPTGAAGNAIIEVLHPAGSLMARGERALAPMVGAVSPRAAENMREHADILMQTRGAPGAASMAGGFAGNIPFMLGGPGGMALAGGSAASDAAFNVEQARRQGQQISSAQAVTNVVLNATLAALTTKLGQTAITGKMAERLLPTLSNALGKTVGSWTGTALTEGGVNVLNGRLNELIEKETGINPNVQLGANDWENFLIGAGGGVAARGAHVGIGAIKTAAVGEANPNAGTRTPSLITRMRGPMELAPEQQGPITEGRQASPAPAVQATGESYNFQPGQSDTYGVAPAPPQTTSARPMRLPDPPADIRELSNNEIRKWMTDNGYQAPAKGTGLWSKTRLLTEINRQQRVNSPNPPATLPPNAESLDAGALRRFASEHGIEIPKVIEDQAAKGRPRKVLLNFLKEATGQGTGGSLLSAVPTVPESRQPLEAQPSRPAQEPRPETIPVHEPEQGVVKVPQTARPEGMPTAEQPYNLMPQQRTIPLAPEQAPKPAGPETYDVAPGRPERTPPVQPYGTATPEQEAAHGAVAQESRANVHLPQVRQGPGTYPLKPPGEHTPQQAGTYPITQAGAIANRPGSEFLPGAAPAAGHAEAEATGERTPATDQDQARAEAAVPTLFPGAKVVSPTPITRKAANAFEKVTGVRVVHIHGGAEGQTVNFANPDHPNVVFIDSRNPLKSWVGALSHEWMHTVQNRFPELWHELWNAIPDAMRQKYYDQYKSRLGAAQGMTPEQKTAYLNSRQAAREIGAMAMMDAAGRVRVRNALMGKDATLWDRIIDPLQRLADRLTGKSPLIDRAMRLIQETTATVPGSEIKTEPKITAREIAYARDKAGFNERPHPGQEEIESPKPTEFLPAEESRRKLPKMPELGLTTKTPVPGKRPFPRAIPAMEKLPSDKGAFQAFVDSDAKNAAGAVKSLWQGTKNLFGQQSGETADIARGIWRKRGAELQHRFDQLHTALDATARHVDGIFSKEDMHAAQDAWENGQAQPKPEIQHAVDAIKQAQDERWERINQLDPGGVGYIENYYKHQFKNPEQASDVMAQLIAKRPLGGSSGFRKTRGIPTMAEARALGLEAADDNPIRNGIMALHNMNKYETALEAKKEMQANGLLKDAPERGMPAGWRKANDPIFKGKIMPEPVASLVDNMLDPGLTSNQKFGRLARATLGAGNVANMYQLGLNLFHVAKTSWEAIKSEGAQGTRSLLSIPGGLKEGKYGEAAARAVTAGKKYLMAGTGFGPIIRDFMEGSKIRHEWLKPGTTDAETAAMVALLKEAGHRATPDSTYRAGFTEAMQKAWRDNNVIGAALRLPLSAMEKITAPILHQYVPRIKNGVAAEMARQEMADLGPNPDINDVRRVLGKAIDSVDNRFGMMVNDHLFWHRSVRDIGHLLVRAMSYQTGTAREFGGGAKDVLTAAGQAVQGKGSFTDTVRSNRLAYSLTSPVMAAIAGGITTYALTGHGPTSMLDYFYPDTGKKDADGKPIRLKLPNYENDIYSFTTNPAQTIRNKESGLVGIAAGLASNKNFRGVRISEESPFSGQGLWDRMAWAAGELEPISSQNTRRMIAEGEGWKSLLPEVGVTQAGRGLDWSDAEREGHRILAEQSGEGGRSEEQAMRSDLVSQLSEGIRNGDSNAGKALADAVESGKLPPGEIDRVIKRATGPQGIAGVVERIREPQALMRVWDRMTPEEKKTTAGTVIGRIANSSSLTPDEMQTFLNRISADLGDTK